MGNRELADCMGKSIYLLTFVFKKKFKGHINCTLIYLQSSLKVKLYVQIEKTFLSLVKCKCLNVGVVNLFVF